MGANALNPSYRLYPHPNPFQVIFRRYRIPADNVTSRVAWKFRGGGIHKHGGDCRMRNENRVVYSFFQFLHGSIGIKEKKWVEDSTAGAKRNKETLVSFSGDDLEREENVEIHMCV